MKKLVLLSMGILLIFVFTGCDFLSTSVDIPQNTIDPSLLGEDLDRAIIESIYPKGLKESLDEQFTYAESHTKGRNFVDADIYSQIAGLSPVAAWEKYTDDVSSEIRIPNNEDEIYLTQTVGAAEDGGVTILPHGRIWRQLYDHLL